MKIVPAINSMIEHSDKITKVIKSNNASESEYFFLFKDKYKWSILKGTMGVIKLYYYPDSYYTLDELAGLQPMNWNNINFAEFKDSDIKTTEATESFAELLQTVKHKLFDIDDVLNDIIGTT